MAGWSVTADGSSSLDCGEEASKRCVLDLPDKLRCWFDQFLGVFLEEICTRDSLRPLPPMIGDGQQVDLFKLFWVVRKEGGFDTVSKARVWDSVSGECGLGLGLGGAVKLVYLKYLYLLERLLENKDLDWGLGSSGIVLRKQLLELQEECTTLFTNRKLGDMSPRSLKGGNEEGSAVRNWGRKKRRNVIKGGGFEWDSGTGEKVSDDVPEEKVIDVMSSGGVNGGKLGGDNDEVKSEVVESDRSQRSDSSDDDVVMIYNPATMELIPSRKRKRESFCGMLDWIRTIAADPCDPSVGALPERSKWKSSASNEKWMQVLRARESIFRKRTADSVAEQNNRQNNSRTMHPSMYDDHLSSSSYNLRERQRLEKELRSQSGTSSFSSPASDMGKTSACMEDRIEVRVGPKFQAHILDWTGEASESDPKWLGTRLWPLEKTEKIYLIERDPIGKGRQESCGCPMPGSLECVRFHIAEKRLKTKIELGSAFYLSKFTEMGEEVGLPWKAEEEKKFEAVIKANPPTLGFTFWDDIKDSFPGKTWKELVSYYFNVFLLQRRGYQNRFTPNDINSDDENQESGTAANNFGHEEPSSSKSILKSPQKPKEKCR